MALVLIATEMKNLHGEIQELKHYCALTSFWNPRYLATGCASGSEVICSLGRGGQGGRHAHFRYSAVVSKLMNTRNNLVEE